MPVRRALALLVALAALPAQATMHWRRIDAPAPPVRTGAAAAYVGASQKVVVFGGCPIADCTAEQYTQLLADTWEWDGAHWSEVATGATHPPARWGAAFSANGESDAILFGGRQNGNLQDTWSWALGRWRAESMAPDFQPPTLWFPAAAPGPVAGKVSFFGGRDGSNVDNALVWSWDGSGWASFVNDSAQKPAAVMGAAFAFDSARKQFVLFGGNDLNLVPPSGQFLTASCLGSGCLWTAPGVATPPARWGHAMAYDARRRVTVLFGGNGSRSGGTSGFLDDTWEWDGSAWHQIALPSSPPARMRHALVYDEARGQVVLYGGTGTDRILGDTWVYEEVGTGTPDAGTPVDPVDAGGGGGGGTVDAGSTANRGPDAGTSDTAGHRGDEQKSVYGCSTASLGAPLLVVALVLLARRRRTLLVLLFALGAANAQAETAKHPRLAFLGLQTTSVPKSEADSLGEFVQSEAAALGAWDVVGLREIDTLLGLEQKKQLLGCDDDTGCLAEIGGMLGVERTLSGSVARLGDTLMVNLWLLDSRKARVVARVGRRIKAPGSIEPALDLVPAMLRELAQADGAIAPSTRTWSVGVRGELDVASTGGLGALRVGVDGELFGAALSLLAPALGGRIEGLVHPVTLGVVRPYVALGASLVRGVPLARGAAGVELALGHARVQLDVAKELLLSAEAGLTNPLLVGAGAGWAF